MARYKWDLDELRNNIKLIEYLLAKEKDSYTRKIMIDVIQQYRNMMHCVVPDTKKEEVTDESSKIQTMEDFLEDILDGATKYDEKLLNLLIGTYPLIKDFTQSNNTQYIICKNNDALLEDTNDFLKQVLTKSQYQRFVCEIYNNPNHLHIKYSPFTGGANGTLFIDPILRKKYIFLVRNNEPIDITSIAHEYFHFVFNDFDSHKIFENNLCYSSEIEGSFANLLTIEDLRDNNPEIAQQLEEDFLLYYQIRIICLLILKCYDAASIKKYQLNNNKFHNLLNSYGFNEKLCFDNVRRYFGTEGLDDCLSYALSYLASIDLMKIYENDPEFALYLLEKIRSLRKCSDVLKVFRKNHITFMDDGFENLKKYVKKIERQN